MNLTGTLNNANATFTLSPAIGTWDLDGGTISGGTITSTGGSTLALTNSGGTLAGGVTVATGTTLDGTQNIGSQEYAYVTGGLTLNGAINLGNSSGSVYGDLYFENGPQTLSGTGTVTFGTSTANHLEAYGPNTAATLTIASTVSVQGGSGNIGGSTPVTRSSWRAPSRPARPETRSPSAMAEALISLSNFTSLNVSNRATINIPESLQVNGSSSLTVDPSSSLTVDGNLLGATQKPALFNPQGTVTLNGAGTAAAPELLEAMSADLGYSFAAFTNNFAYGTLKLAANTYVELVNNAVNSPGASSEAVYVNTLIVPAGATLNLNGLHLYAQTAEISGTITGGVVLPQTVDWISTTSGDWNVGSNWSTGQVPGPGDDVVISPSTPLTVTIDSGSQSVNTLLTESNATLSLSGGSLAVAGGAEIYGSFQVSGSVTLDGTFTGESGSEAQLSSGTLTGGAGGVTVDFPDFQWAGGSLIGPVTNLGTLTVTTSGVSLAGTLTNAGSIVLDTGVTVYQASPSSGASIINQAGATFDLQGTADLSNDYINGNVYDGGTFTNAGTLEKSTGTGTATIAYAITGAGAIVVDSATLEPTGTVTGTNASITVASGRLPDVEHLRRLVLRLGGRRRAVG